MTPSPRRPSGQANPQGIEGAVQLLIKRKNFSSAAAYNLRCLDSMLTNNGVAQDTQAVRRLMAADGVKAVLECLADCRSSAGQVLLQAGCTVLNRALRACPETAAASVDELGGVHTVIEALDVIDEWPPQAIEFLGLMAEGGRADSVLEHGGLTRLLKALRDSLDHDADMAATAVLAIGRALGHTTLARDQVLPNAEDREVLAEALAASVHRSQLKTGEHVRAGVGALLWLARGDPAMISLLHAAGINGALLGLVSKHEGEGSELLSPCGELLYLVSQGPDLDSALDAVGKADWAKVEQGEADVEAVTEKLTLVAGVALTGDGRKAVAEAKGVVDKILTLCDTEAYDCVRLALRAMERMCADEAHGRDLLQRGAMEKAMGVLKRSASTSGYDAVPGEVVAAAASVVARLTEVMLLRSVGNSDSQRLARKSSFGYSEAKIEALRCAVSAYGRHPGNILLFRGLLDLAISNLRRRRGHPSFSTDELGASEEELAVMATAVETLVSLTDVDMQRSHQAVFREKLWSVNGISAVVECLSCHDRDTGPKLCGVLCLASVMTGAKAKDLPFLLHYSQAGEDLLNLLKEDHSFHKDGRELIELLTPLLELKPRPEEAKLTQQDADEQALLEDQPPPPPEDAALPPVPPTPSGVADGTFDISDDEDGGGRDEGQELEDELPPEDEEGGGEGLGYPEEEDEVLMAADDEEEEQQLEQEGGEGHVLANPPQWVQMVDRRGLVYYLNSETGVVQWEVPQDLLNWWELNGIGRAEEQLRECNGWVAKVDPITRTVYYEVEGVDMSGRHWRLPSDVPVNLDSDAPMTAEELASRDSAATASPYPGAVKSQFGFTADLEEEEGEEVADLLQSLLELRQDADRALQSHQGPSGFVRHLQQYGELTKHIRARKRKPGSEGRPIVELEKSLCASLHKALEVVDDASSLLDYYKGAYERELAAHERKGEIGPLEATMALLKGEVIQHTPAELPGISKIIHMIEKNPNEVEKLFKEAHLLIKRLVVQQTGEMAPNTHWTLTQEKLDSIPEIYLHQLLHNLRLLVIAYDNMTDHQKYQLTTAAEIIKNRDWLVSLAVRCVEHQANLAKAVGAGPPHLRRTSSTLSTSTANAAMTVTSLASTTRSKGPLTTTLSKSHHQGLGTSTSTAGGLGVTGSRMGLSSTARSLGTSAPRRASEPGSAASRQGSLSARASPGSTSMARKSTGSSTTTTATSRRTQQQPAKGAAPASSKAKPAVKQHVAVRGPASPQPHAALSSSTSSVGSTSGKIKPRFDPYASPQSKAIPLPESPTLPRRPTSGDNKKVIIRSPVKVPLVNLSLMASDSSASVRSAASAAGGGPLSPGARSTGSRK